MGSEMSDEVLRGFMKPVDADKAKSPGKSSDMWPRMAKLFVDGGNTVEEIDYKAMGRKWSAVAQSLRVALRDTSGENGEKLSTVAYVSVNKEDQTIFLRKKDSSGPTGPGRPPKRAK